MSDVIYKALDSVELCCMCALCEHRELSSSVEPCDSCAITGELDGNFTPNDVAVKMAERILFLKSQE